MSEELQTTLAVIWIIVLILSFAIICVGAIEPVVFFIALGIGTSVGALIGAMVGGVGWGVAASFVLTIVIGIVWLSRASAPWLSRPT